MGIGWASRWEFRGSEGRKMKGRKRCFRKGGREGKKREGEGEGEEKCG